MPTSSVLFHQTANFTNHFANFGLRYLDRNVMNNAIPQSTPAREERISSGKLFRGSGLQYRLEDSTRKRIADEENPSATRN